MNINVELELFKAWVKTHNPADHLALLLEFSEASYERTAESMTFIKPQTERDWSVWQARACATAPAHVNTCKESAAVSLAPVTARPDTPMTIDEMNARIQVLSDEMDANDEENTAMQAEIDSLYVAIDSTRAAEKFVALMEQ